MERKLERSLEINPRGEFLNHWEIRRDDNVIGYVSFPSEAVSDSQDKTPRITLITPDGFITFTSEELEHVTETIKSEMASREASKSKTSFV